MTKPAENQARAFNNMAFLMDSIESGEASCSWKPDDDGVFDTGCDNKFFFAEGTPTDNEFKFCPYCGKHLKEG